MDKILYEWDEKQETILVGKIFREIPGLLFDGIDNSLKKKTTENIIAIIREWLKEVQPSLKEDDWISVENRPLFTKDEKGNWTCTDDGDKPFIAAVPYNDKKRPNENLWWIRHCIVEDTAGLCVVGDDDNYPAGWQLEDITHFIPFTIKPPKINKC